MSFDLEEFYNHSVELGFEADRSLQETLAVTLMPGVVLEFVNLVDESDTLIGFRDTPWHTHDTVMLMVGKTEYLELSEYELLWGLKSGDVLIVERYLDATLDDRWVAHKLEPLDLKYIEPGEELRILRLG
jgi:hypothetical protein